MKSNRVAYGVRVKLNSKFQEKCLGDKYLKNERILFIADTKPFNDAKGEYVHVRGGSLVNSGYAYLDELDLEFEVPEDPLYAFDEKKITDDEAAGKYAENYIASKSEPSHVAYEVFKAGCKFKEEQIKGKTK